MNILETFATLGLKADGFFKGIERAMQRMEEFASTVSAAADTASASMNNLAIKAENTGNVFNGITFSEIFAAIVEKLKKALEYFSKMTDALMEMKEKGFSLTTVLKKAFEGLKILGSLESIKKGIEIVKRFGEKLIDIGENAIRFITGKLAAFGAKLAALKPKLIAFAIKMKAAFPFMAIIAAVAAIGKALKHLWETNEEFRDKVIAVWEFIANGVSDIFAGVVNFFTVTLPGAFQSVLNFVQNNWQNLIGFITNPITNAISYLYNLNSQFMAWVNNLIAGIKYRFGAMFQIGQYIVTSLVNGIRDTIDAAKYAIAGFFGGITNMVRNLFGINSPSRVFASIGESLGEGLVDGVESMHKKAEKSMKDMTDMMTKAAEGAEIVPRIDVERSLSYQIKMFSETYEEVKRIIITAFEAVSRKAQEIIRRMSINIDMFLRTSGFQTGRNFFGALGDGLIAEEGRLMSEAMRVADAIGEIFEQRQSAFAFAAMSMQNDSLMRAANDFVRMPYDDYGVVHGGDNIINQHFSIVKEKETGFQAYRAAQKALAMDMDRQRY